jgi:hypothetical protein
VLWREWHRLQVELSRVRHSAVIGYQNISPRISYAQRPDDWYHHEGDSTYLWGGWDALVGNRWFRIGRGELTAEALSLPHGRDVHQAIDAPLVEATGGPIWERIPADALVVGLDLAGVASVYPVLVLEKVKIVNDVIEGRPILVTYNGFAPPGESVNVYEATLDGQRVTMGTSGYFQGREPLFYDRGSESLWRRDAAETLRAVAGPSKGKALRAVPRPAIVAWDDWRGRFPGSRLLVGAEPPPRRAVASTRPVPVQGN